MSRSGVQLKKSAGWFGGRRRSVVQGYRRGKVKALKSTNLLERLNEELNRRTLVVRIFPSVSETLNRSPLIRGAQSSRQPNFGGMLRYVRDLCDALQAF